MRGVTSTTIGVLAVIAVAIASLGFGPQGIPGPPEPDTSHLGIAIARVDLHRTGVAQDASAITNPVVRWSFLTNGTSATSPLAADFDGDGQLEILVGEVKPTPASDGSRLGYLLDSTGNIQTTVPMRHNSIPAAIADVDRDGELDLVMTEASHSDQPGDLGYRVFRADGSPLWSFTTPFFGGEGFFASPALADIDGDGGLDLLAGSMDHSLYALRGVDGSVIWQSPQLEHYVRHSSPLADLDGDARADIVVHTEAGIVHVYDAASGAVRWEVPTGNIVAATPAIGDLDGDGELDLVVSHVTTGGVVALRGDGSILWQRTVHDFSYRSPALIDVDRDGLVDVVEGDANDPAIAAYRGTDGAVLWDTPLPGAWASGPIVAAEVDGDGEFEIVAGSDVGLVVLDAATGTVEWILPLPSIRGEPLVRDIDGDGDAEILVGAGDGRLYVIANAPEPRFEPRTIGYWKHQCRVDEPRGDHIGVSQAFVDAIRNRSGVFADLSSPDEACAILQGPRGDDMGARAEQQLLALWLNVVSGLVDEDAAIDLPMTSAATVGEAIAEVESILLGTPSRGDLERAKDICDALNNGMR